MKRFLFYVRTVIGVLSHESLGEEEGLSSPPIDCWRKTDCSHCRIWARRGGALGERIYNKKVASGMKCILSAAGADAMIDELRLRSYSARQREMRRAVNKEQPKNLVSIELYYDVSSYPSSEGHHFHHRGQRSYRRLFRTHSKNVSRKAKHGETRALCTTCSLTEQSSSRPPLDGQFWQSLSFVLILGDSSFSKTDIRSWRRFIALELPPLSKGTTRGGVCDYWGTQSRKVSLSGKQKHLMSSDRKSPHKTP